MHLGYYISPTKSTVVPTQEMIHLGFGINSKTSSYFLTDKYRRKFQVCRSALLASKTASLKDIQKWVGKCNHLRLLFPASSLFTFQCRQLMSTLDDAPKPLSPLALEEIGFWTFVDTFTEPVPFFHQQHASFTLSTDASGYAWGASVSLPSGPLELRDYWNSNLFRHDICTKEALAVLFALRALEGELYRRRVDVYVDNMGLVHAWASLKTKSAELLGVLKELFLFCADHRITLKMVWVSTKENPADAPSRALDRRDSSLAPTLRARLWSRFGPLSFDLMATSSNVLCTPSGAPLPFYSRDPLPSSAGTNLFAQRPPVGRSYVFPPFQLIIPVIRLLMEWGGLDVVLVLPVYDGSVAGWLSLLRPFIIDEMVLSASGAVGAIMIPTSSGYGENVLPLAFGLSAFLCRFPSAPPPPPLLPVVKRRVLVFSDSMLRPLEKLSWPSSFAVVVRCFSGASLMAVVRTCLKYFPSAFDMAVIHAAVNDASRGNESFESVFKASCDDARLKLRSRFPSSRIVLSLACVTALTAVNSRVAIANRLLRETAVSGGFGLISNDNIQFADLCDNVHLNAAGTARIYSNILNYLRADAS